MTECQRTKIMGWLVNELRYSDEKVEIIFSKDGEVYILLWLNEGSRLIGYDSEGENIFSEPYGEKQERKMQDLSDGIVCYGLDEIISYLDIYCDIHN